MDLAPGALVCVASRNTDSPLHASASGPWMALKLTLSIVHGVWESTASLEKRPFGEPLGVGCVGWCRAIVGASVS